ncbi:TIGR04282 family arsenosugar biosynthesis glycosyltransferase [Micromonospora sp. WMMD714]|uniref:TIGR04282 family arsenosugar biosynthesis glycosyltransferase n=1 Tax=Micromonospora sp. WMMD714 TaxID=3016097 RepID=UPI00249ADCA0|nr:TIGR04282 family arsenosugar biosynthesis glycosyltransferase [Micromonospora sp. WMMD714]WFE66499.1 TIGR04282 family arsenosugar biosynthesis glycosyltransferase [Micromonospora sp. WMMD714]
MNGPQVLVLAKKPEPGRVKTRLCPPCTPEQAARVAAAALADTLATVTTATAGARVLVVDGDYPAPPGWTALAQRGGPLGDRLAAAFADTRAAGTAALLIGMDTPQLTVGQLDSAVRLLGASDGPDAVFGPADDGGWWTLGLRDPGHAEVLRTIPTSVADTGRLTLAALRRRGLRVHLLPRLRDVDTAADAHAVAAECPASSRFAAAVAAHVPTAAAAAHVPTATAAAHVPTATMAAAPVAAIVPTVAVAAGVPSPTAVAR